MSGGVVRHKRGDFLMALCYRDMTFCSAQECVVKDCPRYFSNAVIEAAKAWGGEDAPIAFSDFRETCKDYRVETDDD